MDIFSAGSGLSHLKEVNKGDIIIIIFSSNQLKLVLGKERIGEKSEERMDCHHQDSNQGPSLVPSVALTTELWLSRHPSRGRSTFSSDFVTHTS